MDEDNHQSPGLATLLSRVGQTTTGLLRNRAELLSVEWQEEKARLISLLVWGLVLLFLVVFAIGLVTATIIALIPADYRVWALGGFAVLYLAGAGWAAFTVKGLLKNEPFPESIEQLKKDTALLERTE